MASLILHTPVELTKFYYGEIVSLNFDLLLFFSGAASGVAITPNNPEDSTPCASRVFILSAHLLRCGKIIGRQTHSKKRHKGAPKQCGTRELELSSSSPTLGATGWRVILARLRGAIHGNEG